MDEIEELQLEPRKLSNSPEKGLMRQNGFAE